MSEQDFPGDSGYDAAEDAEVVLDDNFDSPLASDEVTDLEDIEELEDFEELEDDFSNLDDVNVESEIEGDTSVEAVVVVADEASTELEAPELTIEQAQELTEHIRSTSDVLYVLVARAHAGKAHKAMGYTDFGAYVKAEFDISRSRAYQFINQASVIQAIEEATPEGTQFKLSEAAARDLKNYVEELAPEIRDATRDLDPDEAGSVVEEMVSGYRDKLADEKNKVDEDFDLDLDFDLDDIDYDAPEFDGEGGGGGSQFDDMEGFDALDDFDSDGTEKEDRSIDIEDASVFRNKLENVYAFYAALNSLEKMPEVDEILGSIQETRRAHLNASLPKAKAWLDAMHEAWFAAQGVTDDSAEGVDISDEIDSLSPEASTHTSPKASLEEDEDFEIDADFDGPAWDEEESSEKSDDTDFDFDNDDSVSVSEEAEDIDGSR